MALDDDISVSLLEHAAETVTWFFTWPNFVGLLVGIVGSGTLFTTAGAASAATHPPLHEDAVKRAPGPR